MPIFPPPVASTPPPPAEVGAGLVPNSEQIPLPAVPSGPALSSDCAWIQYLQMLELFFTLDPIKAEEYAARYAYGSASDGAGTTSTYDIPSAHRGILTIVPLNHATFLSWPFSTSTYNSEMLLAITALKYWEATGGNGANLEIKVMQRNGNALQSTQICITIQHRASLTGELCLSARVHTYSREIETDEIELAVTHQDGTPLNDVKQMLNNPALAVQMSTVLPYLQKPYPYSMIKMDAEKWALSRWPGPLTYDYAWPETGDMASLGSIGTAFRSQMPDGITFPPQVEIHTGPKTSLDSTGLIPRLPVVITAKLTTNPFSSGSCYIFEEIAYSAAFNTILNLILGTFGILRTWDKTQKTHEVRPQNNLDELTTLNRTNTQFHTIYQLCSGYVSYSAPVSQASDLKSYLQELAEEQALGADEPYDTLTTSSFTIDPVAETSNSIASRPLSAVELLKRGALRGTALGAVDTVYDKAVGLTLEQVTIPGSSLRRPIGRQASKAAFAAALLALMDVAPELGNIKGAGKLRQLLSIAIEATSGDTLHEVVGSLENMFTAYMVEPTVQEELHVREKEMAST